MVLVTENTKHEFISVRRPDDTDSTRRFFYRTSIMNRPFHSNLNHIVAVVAASLAFASSVAAQGLDDLFERPMNSRVAFAGEDAAIGRASNELRRSGPPNRIDRIPESELNRGDRSFGNDDQNETGPLRSPSDMNLVEDRGSYTVEQRRKATAMEIRQARALEETRQRIARIEAARWSGNPTLRPSWNPDPTTSSRYSSTRIIRVPVYIYRHQPVER